MEVARPVRRAGRGNPPAEKLTGRPRSDPYTYIPTKAEFLYLAAVIDIWSRRVVGWLRLTRFGGRSKTWVCSQRGVFRVCRRRERRIRRSSERRWVRLVRAGRTPGELSREFEPSDQTIRNWVNQADVDEGRREGLTTVPARRSCAELASGESDSA